MKKPNASSGPQGEIVFLYLQVKFRQEEIRVHSTCLKQAGNFEQEIYTTETD